MYKPQYMCIIDYKLSFDEDIEDDINRLHLVTLKETNSLLKKLGKFSLQSGVSVEVFKVSFTLENSIQ